MESLTNALGKLDLEEVKIKHFVVEAKSIKYDDGSIQGLIAAFENFDHTQYNGLTLGGNSYGSEACHWVAENVLKKWSNLREA